MIVAWKDDDKIAEIFNDIDRERHTDLGQTIKFDELIIQPNNWKES